LFFPLPKNVYSYSEIKSDNLQAVT
jgi:hypothetical protein